MADAPATATGDFIGYIVEDGTPVTELSCEVTAAGANNVLRSVDGFLYCNRSGVFTNEVGTACDGDLWHYSSSYLSTSAGSVSTIISTGSRFCDTDRGGCMTATVYRDESPDADSLLLYGCAYSFGVTEAYETVFAQITNPPETSTTRSSRTSEITSEITSETTSESTTGTTTGPTNGPTDGSSGGGGGSGNDVGVIVGAVVGSIAGLALIIGIIFFAYRAGRKRGAKNPDGNNGGGFSNMPRPSIVWTRKSMPPQAMPGPYKGFYPMAPVNGQVELGTGGEHAGWAGSQPQQYPQEMYVPPQHQRYG